MEVYANAKLVACGSKEFIDKETGNPVKYFEIILKSQDGKVATVTSGADYNQVEGQSGIAVLRIKDTGKLSLYRFIVGAPFEEPEKEIF